ncbi:MAG: hypothetical protein MZV70_12680 [Desulfobacterales bacterium]|nr:hypothetical protein [Desulfobacterales bacterium]
MFREHEFAGVAGGTVRLLPPPELRLQGGGRRRADRRRRRRSRSTTGRPRPPTSRTRSSR